MHRIRKKISISSTVTANNHHVNMQSEFQNQMKTKAIPRKRTAVMRSNDDRISVEICQSFDNLYFRLTTYDNTLTLDLKKRAQVRCDNGICTFNPLRLLCGGARLM
jgi:hypothetical protein